tara:strand:+ start:349 stop:753 length:405 start_codon:yes stop_codon:yes gene_type:complete
MGFRCELCDEWLPMLQFSKLCPTCYKIRTIVKCYSAKEILENLEKTFLVSDGREAEVKREDEKFFVNEEKRLEKEFIDELARLQEQSKTELPPLIENNEEDEIKPLLPSRHEGVKGLDGDAPQTRNRHKNVKKI